MKYVYMTLIFVVGIAIGRLSAPQVEVKNTNQEITKQTTTESAATSPEATQKFLAVDEKSPTQTGVVTNTTSIGTRTQNHVREKQMLDLAEQLWRAKNKDDVEEQNRLFAEMEKLDSKHEKVFEAKVQFLQEDENWNEAHKVLKECVTILPDSIYCLRRLSNIRSSTNEDKLRYGAECLRVSPNDPLCLVDLAIAFHTKGDFEKAKFYFEQALNLPAGGEGYFRDYILMHYGETLERLNLHQKARAAYTEACKLRNKMACEKLTS